MKIIAICSNLVSFDVGALAWHDRKITDQFPGSGWLHYLDIYAKLVHVQVIPGIQALRLLNQKKVDPKDIYVLQEELNMIGESLIKKGAHASVLFCLESPLYVPGFYKELPSLKKTFKAQILFGDLGTHRAYFPSFDPMIYHHLTPWKDRTKWVSMVVSNKNLNSSDVNELQTIRYIMIEAFKKAKPHTFDLYGKGWGKGYGFEIPPGKKVETISQYRFNICFENYMMEGYVTEKIVECLEAGCLPIYSGAPDICKFIPHDCFHDPNAGPDFLQSESGQKFSYQYFAKQILEIIGD